MLFLIILLPKFQWNKSGLNGLKKIFDEISVYYDD